MNYDQRHRIVFNVDYRYGQGEAYNGPMIGKSQIFANTGFNLITNLGSGTPFTSQVFPTPDYRRNQPFHRRQLERKPPAMASHPEHQHRQEL